MLGLERLRALRGLWRHMGLVGRGHQPIYLDYAVDARPRYGWGRPVHEGLQPLVAAGRETCASLLRDLHAYAERLRAIPVSAGTDPRTPYWANGYLGGVDAATLYAFPAHFRSKTYVEIGSGNSTKFVRRSAQDHGLDLRIVSIDPRPRAEIDDLCDQVVRSGLERAPLELFDALEANDILMCDGSHRCLQNSDVTVLFLEVLPRLRAGVLVYIDDVYLPCDYPPEWAERYYSEQYLLAVLLLADAGRRYEVLFPGHLVTLDSELRALEDELWRRVAVPGLTPPAANGMWLRVRG